MLQALFLAALNTLNALSKNLEERESFVCPENSAMEILFGQPSLSLSLLFVVKFNTHFGVTQKIKLGSHSSPMRSHATFAST